MSIGKIMKKSILLISLFLFSCSPAEVQSNSTINYTVNPDTMTARVVESTKFNKQTLTIPETITYKEKVYKVVSIAKEAFKDNKHIKTINMPNSITSIGYDHMHILGKTLPEIAYQKAGIIKENSAAVLCAIALTSHFSEQRESV